MSSGLRALSPAALVALADEVEGRTTAEPLLPIQLNRLGIRDADGAAAELETLRADGLSGRLLARYLRMMSDERKAAQAAVDRTELVWSGPEVRGAGTRDTAVVVRELFAGAERSVHVSTYVIHDGIRVFATLAERMEQRPSLQVRLFVHIGRPRGEIRPVPVLLSEYRDAFRRLHWPWQRVPEVFYDPRALATTSGSAPSLHAKVVVIDDRRAFVTSANFTEAAQDRNIEAGVLVESPFFAGSVRRQFDTLVEGGGLARLPLR